MGEDPQPSHTFEALVTHVVDTEMFWVQALYNNEDRKKLTIIESALGANPKPVSKMPKPDDYVSVKLNERGWRRARLKQHIQHSLAHVQLIDYGNDEQVPESVIFNLSSELGIDVLNEQAMLCSLAGVKPNPRQQNVGHYLNGILLNRKVSIKAYSISPEGRLLVDVTTAEIPSVRHHVLLHQIATPGMIPAAPHTQDPGTIQPKIGERNAVIISHIADLIDFYVQYRAAEKSIASMMTAMKSMYAANVHSPAKLINIGMLCTVQLGSDWFRAEIKQVLSTGFILVMLKDFGNLQQVTAKQIYPLEGNLMKTSFYAIRCGLNNILPSTPTATGSFPKQLIQWFERYAADQGAYYSAQFIRKADNRYYIELFDDTTPAPGAAQEPKPSTIELLITNNCAKRVANNFPSYGGMQQQLNQMGVDMFNNLAQSTNASQQQLYNTMMNSAAMTTMNGGAGGYGNFNGNITPGLQATGSAPFMGNGVPGGINTGIAQQAAPLVQSQAAPGNFMTNAAPISAEYASSAGPQQSAGGYSSNMAATQPRVPRSRGESKVPSDVHQHGYSLPQIGGTEEVAVEIVQTPWEFTCLLNKYFNDVDDINDQMEAAYKNTNAYSLPSSRAKIGMACVAPFMENGQIRFYRARIEMIHQNNADVFFVDYGNMETVPLRDLKYLKTSFAKVPESQIKCSFDNVTPTDDSRDWGHGAMQAFKSFFAETINFICHIIKHPSSDKNVYKVELFPAFDNVMMSPVSKELEMRGVLVCGSDIRGGERAANRGRNAGARPTRDPVDSEFMRPAARDRSVKDRGRGDRERSDSPVSSAATNELIRCGYKPTVIELKSYIDIRVTHTYNPSKFSCQILSDKDELDELYQKMQDYYDSAGDGDVLDDTIPFTGCAVFYDNAWQRGYIHSSSYHGCQVVLVDTQQVVSVDQDQLRTMRPSFSKFPVQGVKCSLDGINCKLNTGKWNSETCRYFAEQVADIDLIGQFRSERNGVYNILLHTTRDGVDQMINALFVVKGWALAKDMIVKQAVEDVQSSLQNKFTMYSVPIGSSITVSPCHVEGPDEFYLHPVDEQANIEDMQARINDFYDRNQSTKPQLAVDSYCVAYWDDSWYRARIVSVSRDTCEVYFVDFGNTDIVEISKIRGLAKQFKQNPMYAIRCSLEGLNPDNMIKMKDIFMALVEDDMDSLHATFIKLNKGSYLVSMYDGSRPILEKIFELFFQGGSNMGGGARARNKSRAPSGPPSVPLEDRSLVQISHPDTPHLLYLHSNASETTLEGLRQDMNRFYSTNKPTLPMKQVGELCAAQYSEDGEWYRGRIVSQHGDMLQVQFFDYGNDENKRNSEVYGLDKQFSDLAAQATPCCLDGINEPPQGWNDVRDELLNVAEMQFTVKLVDESCYPIKVELFNAAAGVSLTRELINNGYGIDSERKSIPMHQVPAIDGGTFQVKVCYADFPGRMFVQKMSQAEKLEELVENLKADYDQSQPKLVEDAKIGTVCCAKYTDDDYYYRATVYGITRHSFKIQFVDFGNCEDKRISELYDLKDEYTLLSCQAIECSLRGCDVTSQKWTPEMQGYLEEVVDNKTFNCQILGRNGEAYEVSLHEMSTGDSLADIVNKYVSTGSKGSFGGQSAPAGGSFGGAASNSGFGDSSAPAPPAPKTDEVVKVGWPPRIDKFEHVPAMISWGDGPEDFWINLVDSDSKLDQLQDKLQEVYGNGGRQPSRIFRYMYLAVKSPSFDQVFRGKTLNNDRNCPTINYIDYGNEEDVPVSNLYELEPYLANVLGAQAIHCMLDGVDRLKPEGELRDELKTKFEELLSDKEVQVKNISPAQRDKPHNEIEILVEGQNLVEILEKELIALSGPPDVATCTAAVGNVLQAALTSISSPTDFWCQIAGPMANMNEKLKNCTDNLPEAPEMETYCAAVLGENDETIYRARVLSKNEHNFVIRCIDYGYRSEVPLKNLYKLKQDCAELPAQAFPCALPVQVTEDKVEEAVAALKTLSSKCVSVKLYSHSDDRFTIDFKPEDHLKLLVEPSLAISTLPSPAEVSGVYTPLVVDPEATYFISHINNLSDFYVQKSDLDADDLATKVAAACGGMLSPLKQATRGNACVVKDSTYQAWNRGLITDIVDNDTVNVLFLDYGSKETVKKGTLKELPAALKDIPVAAVHCTLDPLPENYTNFTELFTTITGENEVSLRPTETSGVSVTMHGLPITDVFDKATHYSTLTFEQPKLQNTGNVYCTSVEGPHNVWVQLAEYEEQLATLMGALAEYCPAAPGLYTTVPGTVCCALFPDDESWYRAEVTKVTGDKVTVLFVDYGNSCEVEKSSLKLIPEEHLVLPVNSVLVRLANVRPADGKKFTDAVIDKLFEITSEQLCEMKLTSYRAMQHVTLSIEGTDVVTSLCELDDAKLIPDPEILTVPALTHPEGEAGITITHVEQVDEIYGSLDDKFETMEGLTPEITDLVTVDQLFKPLHCWAKWQDNLYRAILTDFDAKQADVWFVDYGNRDKVQLTDVYYLKPEHTELPGIAIRFKLTGIKPVRGEWDTAAKTKLNELVENASTTIALPAIDNVTVSSEALPVVMVIEEVNVSEMMKNNKLARSEIQPPVVTKYPEHTFPEEQTLFSLGVTGTTVSCQLGDQLEEIQEKLQGAIVEGHPDYIPEGVTVDMACVCKFYDDKEWYRALVSDISGDRVTVQFVDYGNSQVSKMNEIQLLPEEFNAPAQVFDIELANTEKMTDTDKLFLSKMMLDQELIMTSVSADNKTAVFYLPGSTEEEERREVVAATIEHSAAIGAYPPFPALEPDHVVYTCEINSPEEFFIQIDGCEDVLGEIEALMTAHTDKSPVTSPFTGQPVLAVFETILYRGVLTELAANNMYNVRFVDYGNSSLVKEIFEPTPAEVAFPPQALRCALDKTVPVSGDKHLPAVKDRLTAMCNEVPLCVVEVRKENDAISVMDKLFVSLTQDERNLRMKLLQENLIGDEDDSLGSYERVPKPTKPVEVEVTHVENDNLWFGYRTGGEKEEKDEDDDTPEEEDDLIDAAAYVEEYQTVLEDATPPVLETVEVGTLCVTRWEGALYRATVIWIHHNYVKVRFVDYGNCWYTSLTELLDCPEPFRGPGLALPFSGKLADKQVSAEGHYLITAAEQEAGSEIMSVNVAIPKVKVMKYKHSKLEIGTATQLYVSVALPHGQMFCQSAEGGELLETIAPLIDTAVAARKPAPAVVEDAPVLGAYEGAYYRGKVVSVLPGNKAKVLFVDYGNTEECANLLDITPELMAHPAVGINCQLQDLTFVGIEGKTALDTHVFPDAELTVTATSYDKTNKQFAVTAVTAEEVDIISAVSEVNITDKVLPEPADRSIPLNTVISAVYCSKFNSPADFCVQAEEDTDLLETISTQAAACPKIQINSVKKGAACLAQDPKDKLYYRAVITETEPAIRVHYVDYGNRETVELSALYDISAELLEHKICGIQCTLPDVMVPEAGWNADNLKQLQTMCSPETELNMSVLSAPVGHVYTVQVIVNGGLLRKHVQNDALSPLTQSLSYPRFEGALDLFISVGNDPTDFYGQREEDGDRLAVLRGLVDKTEKTALENVQPGVVCLGESSGDSLLYRAEVVSIDEGSMVTVRFVDYGNCEQISADKVYQITDELLSLPVYAVPMTLFGIEECDSWSEAALACFAEHCYEDGAVQVTVRNWKDNKCEVDVKLMDLEGLCLKAALVEAGHVVNTDPDFVLSEVKPAATEPAATASEIKTGPVLQYQKLPDGPNTVFVAVADSHDLFFVQTEQMGEDVAVLQEHIDTAPQTVLTAPAPGAFCFALSTESEGLYRAEILQVSAAGVLLRYVDYGNTETVAADKVYQLTEQMVAAPVYSVPCSLDISGDVSPAAMEVFKAHVVADAEVTVIPKSWSPTQVCICTVQNGADGTDVSAAMAGC